jgi:hypothetical protein
LKRLVKWVNRERTIIAMSQMKEESLPVIAKDTQRIKRE